MAREPLDTSILSDDDYDVISDPDSSVPELPPRPIYEPQPTPTARAQFQTASLTAEDIQTFVQNALPSSASFVSRTVRVYVDGPWDAFNVSHALLLRQAKLSFPKTSLLVGVFSDTDCKAHGTDTSAPYVERAEIVRHCRWVDDVLSDVPWQLNLDFLKQHRIDFVVVPEGTSVDPACDKERLKGYDDLKTSGKVIPARRTTGLYQPPVHRNPPPPAEEAPLTDSKHNEPLQDDEDSPFRHIDQYGIGI